MRAGNVTRQAGTKTRPFVFLNETGGEKTARETFLLCPRRPPSPCQRSLVAVGLGRFVTSFSPRSKNLLISWLQLLCLESLFPHHPYGKLNTAL